MSDLGSVVDFLENTEKNKDNEEEQLNETFFTDFSKTEIVKNENTVFDIQEFGNELSKMSEDRNKARAERPNQNITGYDIADNCIMQVLYKLRNTPIQNYADSWLPIYMRSEVGTAVHNFIQGNTKQFTETELNLKVPSIRFYGKVDYMINDTTLGEIKTCTYSDYKTIVNKQKPRDKDFLQAFCYHYMLTRHLDEIKSDAVEIKYGMGEKPKLNKYNIKQIQFIYIAHDIISSHAESYAQMVECAKIVKQNLSSKRNPFFFITSLVIDLNDELIATYHEHIESKLKDIHHYFNTQTNPEVTSRFVSTNKCYFCPYKSICELPSQVKK